MTLNWNILGILLLVVIILLIRQGRKDAYVEPPQGTIITYPDAEEEMFMEIDEENKSSKPLGPQVEGK